MLILTRRIVEKIVIGDNVLITVTVYRNEIYQRILKEREGVNNARNRGTP